MAFLRKANSVPLSISSRKSSPAAGKGLSLYLSVSSLPSHLLLAAQPNEAFWFFFGKKPLREAFEHLLQPERPLTSGLQRPLKWYWHLDFSREAQLSFKGTAPYKGLWSFLQADTLCWLRCFIKFSLPPGKLEKFNTVHSGENFSRINILFSPCHQTHHLPKG